MVNRCAECGTTCFGRWCSPRCFYRDEPTARDGYDEFATQDDNSDF